MRRRFAFVAAFWSALLVAGGVGSTAAAGEAAASYRDFLDEGVTVMAAGADQCAKPTAERTGSWLCDTDTDTDGSSDGPKTLAQKADGGGRRVGHCTLAGCWHRVGPAEAEFSGGGTYGFGKTPLGRVRVFIRIKMNGAQSVSQPVRFRSTRGLGSLTMEGERLSVSKAPPEGTPVPNHTYSIYGPKKAPADRWVEWKPNGYKSYEKKAKVATIVHNFVWTDPSSEHPGRWYFYVKSIKLRKHESGRYDFQDEKDLPKDAHGAGYKVH